MTYRIMCKRSKCDNIIFGDGVMAEIIDLIHSNSKDLIFERENIVTSHPHGLLMRGLSKMCGERLNNELSCGVHYRIYDSAEKELLHLSDKPQYILDPVFVKPKIPFLSTYSIPQTDLFPVYSSNSPTSMATGFPAGSFLV